MQVHFEPGKKDQEKKEDFPTTSLKPMLARLSSEVIDDLTWLYEMKYDGYRLISRINEGKVEMISRNNKSFNEIYGELAGEFQPLKKVSS